jgi:DUF1365 family protein
VSFYYCFNASGQEVETVVAEVSNTPWNEMHCYVLDGRNEQVRLNTDRAGGPSMGSKVLARGRHAVYIVTC